MEYSQDCISEKEAMQVCLGLAHTMMGDDKVGREALYADLNEESLRRVIRWMTRWFLMHFALISVSQGMEPKDGLQLFIKEMNAKLEAGD